MNQLRDSKTRINLMKAFAGESQARNRYTFGASQAKGEKLALIEQAFLYTADQERAHAKVFYNHLKELSGGTIHIDGGYPVEIFDNIAQTLRAAQHDEYEEWEEVYKSFANTAREEGFLAVANSFDKIAQIEKIHGDRFGNITGPPVRICNLIECTFRSLPLQAIACNYIRNSLRRLIGLRIHKPIMRSHHNLLCSVPDMKFFFRYRMNTYTMYPSDIIIRCLNAIPTVAL